MATSKYTTGFDIDDDDVIGQTNVLDSEWKTETFVD